MVAASGPQPARFHFPRFLPWLAATLAAAVAVAWLSAAVQAAGYAPVGLLSLLVGGSLGTSAAALAWWMHAGHLPSLLGGTLAAAQVAVGLQHGFSYQNYLSGQHPAAALFGAAPGSFADFMIQAAAHGATLGLWAADWAVISLGAPAVVYFALRRRPYCNVCRTWYAARRSGALDRPMALRLAERCGLDLPAQFPSAGYVLRHCRSGCGPAGLWLSWRASDGGRTAPPAWLDASARQQVEALLDG